MAFENLFKPPHLRRFLLALAAAVAAITVYFSAEHFQVIPATGALDEEQPQTTPLGERSILVTPAGDNPLSDRSRAVSLELIGRLARQPDLEVISAQSALLPNGQSARTARTIDSFGAGWILEIRSGPEGPDSPISAVLKSSGEAGDGLTLASAQGAEQLARFILAVESALGERLDFEPAGDPSGATTVPPAAYSDYLAARLLILGGGAGLEEAGERLDRALLLAPEWPPALAARAHGLLMLTAAGAVDAEAKLAKARSSLERARQLDPDLPEAWLYTSILAHRFDWDWEAADHAAIEALRLAPGDAAVLAAASTAEFTLAQFDEGVEHLRKAIVLDPLVPSRRLTLGLMLEFGGHIQPAIDAYRELMVLDPAYPAVHAALGRTLVIANRAEAALRHSRIERSPFWRLYGTTLALYALERDPEADQGLQQLMFEYGGEAAVQIAEIYAFTNRLNPAFEWLDRAVEQADPGVANLLGNPLLEPLTQDPRWRDLLDRLGLPAN